MYRVVQSPHSKKLAGALCETLSEHPPSDPLEPVEILVPNRDTSRWLLQFLAEVQGFAGNYLFSLPSEWIWKQIRNVEPDLPERLPSDPGPMIWSLFSLLNEEQVIAQFPDLDRWYQQRRKQRNHEDALWQLARQIGSVFDQYQMYRPEMLISWQRGELVSGESEWQAHLWRLLNDRWKKLPVKGLNKNRAELFEHLFFHFKKKNIDVSAPLYLFNPGLMPPPVCRLLQQLSLKQDLYHYRIQPVSSVPEVAAKFHHPLLQSFGEEQCNQMALFTRFAKSHPQKVRLENLQSLPEGGSNLAALQRSLISETDLPVLERVDPSIEIRSCHSPLREVEVLHDFLTGLFSADKELKPEDVLVVTPDLQAYRPYIEAVFSTVEEGRPEIPFFIAGRSVGSPPVEQAFLHLLSLPETRYHREDLFEFLHHTVIREQFGFSDSDLTLLEEWFDENRVVWGLDGIHRSEFDQPNQELHTWRQAMRRGWLGQLMAYQSGQFMDKLLLFPGIQSSDEKRVWARFQHLLRFLEEVKRRSEAERDPGEWKREIHRWIDHLFVRPSLQKQEISFLKDKVDPLFQDIELAADEQGLSYSLVRKVLEEALIDDFSVTSRFTGGVLFNSMVPVRSLPFPVIALLGLNDESFPRKTRQPSFDLLSSAPRPGERDRKCEDRNLFLESILSAENIHYSSYIGNHPKDNEPIPPSPVLDEWIQSLSTALDLPREKIVKQQSLNGFSLSAFRPEGSERESSFSRAYYQMVRRISSADLCPGLEIDRELDLPEHLASGHIPLKEFERFFRDPAACFFKDRLGVRMEAVYTEDDEFGLDPLRYHRLFVQLFDWILSGKGVSESRRLLLASGTLPEGWPGEQLCNELINLVSIAVEQIQEKDFQPQSAFHSIDITVEAYRLEGRIRSYRTGGFLDLNPSECTGRRLLVSWIRHLIFSLNKMEPGEKSHVIFNLKKKPDWMTFLYEPEAEQILCDLTKLFLEGHRRPLNLYLDSAYQYAANLRKSEQKAASEALRKWQEGRFPEREKPSLQLFLGREAEADQKLIAELAEKIYRPILNNQETAKERV